MGHLINSPLRALIPDTSAGDPFDRFNSPNQGENLSSHITASNTSRAMRLRGDIGDMSHLYITQATLPNSDSEPPYLYELEDSSTFKASLDAASFFKLPSGKAVGYQGPMPRYDGS